VRLARKLEFVHCLKKGSDDAFKVEPVPYRKKIVDEGSYLTHESSSFCFAEHLQNADDRNATTFSFAARSVVI
jgi:hypothetical protein